ncbi:hypothetical protein SDRG_14852 [Saprolegnia diclina VS20]|uniref:AMP-dependent synthetase/ligase domain-containing protein n=1 Tax=Saprolegnia diclina (strain VS20) TaxID=1156394 RepID=T0R5J4_SAPDV|nr:hypothetical protein SDRG_14852 [Saprolegnia diclina VS20]EQC27328.1 hypothetical protein SDRG_14852 [Saprolegnia diclina VS20]|eukprot:XP_008619232.1 hypothetical protein SDRG_14852 [Saprolegnia diclina VS20]
MDHPVSTLFQSLARTARLHPTRPFLGHRPVDANGDAAPYEWQSYASCYERIQAIGSALLSSDLIASSDDDGHKLLGIYMKNRPEWVLAQYAAYYAGATVVPIYDTLGVTSTTFILNQTCLATVVCTSVEAASLLEKAASAPQLRHLVLCDVEKPSEAITTAATTHNLSVTTLKALEETGRVARQPPASVACTDVAILMYTSGTTGNPKGALLTHACLLALFPGIDDRILPFEPVASIYLAGPVMLSYLPLAHVGENQLQAYVIHHGGAIGFYQGSPLKIVDDLQALRPTIFFSVPRLLNRIFDKIMEAALGAGGVKAWLFQAAYDAKLAGVKEGRLDHWFYDRLVFNPLKAKLGLDRCGLLVSAAAPLAPSVMNFWRVVLGRPCVEAYGQTETAGIASVTEFSDLDPGTIGVALTSAEMKLISAPEMGYLTSDTRHGDEVVKGRGEVCIRGPTVFSGYFKEPEKTAEALDADGWLHSGDIGVWTADGRIKLIDRKTNIFKLAQGEYVAAEKIENVLQSSSLVNQAFVYGDSFRSSLVAIIVPDEIALSALAASLHLDGSLADWCRNSEIVSAVLANLTKQSKQEGLLGFETVRAVLLEPTPFSAENGLLTPTFKLKRHDAKVVYAKIIDALYASSGDVTHVASLG